MKFCKVCERVMSRTSFYGKIVFTCSCGFSQPGNPEDTLIASSNTGESIEMYRSLIKNSAHDPTNQFVKKDCPNCKRDYMVQLRIGPSEIIIYKCKCGHEINS